LAVVVDTGPLLAAALKRDPAHELAAALIAYGGRDLLIPDPVVERAGCSRHWSKAFGCASP
jgi:predicted nucleic acid-binding protein